LCGDKLLVRYIKTVQSKCVIKYDNLMLWNRFNKELYDLFKEPRLSVVIRIARLRWAGHVARMDENCMPRRLIYVQPEGVRKVGRPRARWRDEVGKDARMLELRSWWATAMNREEWRKLLSEAKTLCEL
jgi:hypothetical protein